MNPIVHAELSWLAAQGLSHRRDRLLVCAAGAITPEALQAVTEEDILQAARDVLDLNSSVTLWVRAPEAAPVSELASEPAEEAQP